MTNKTTYTFSKKRMFVHLFLAIATSGGWMLVAILWEWYRYINAK